MIAEELDRHVLWFPADGVPVLRVVKSEERLAEERLAGEVANVNRSGSRARKLPAPVVDPGSPLVVHCGESGPDAADGMSQMCMLLDGHEGPHQWTRDDEILVEFLGADREWPDRG